MSWAGVSVTTDVAEPVPTSVSQTDTDAGSTYPSITQDAQEPVPDYEVHQETIEVKSLLSGDGIRQMFTTVVQNFNDFGVVAVILVAMIGVGVAEEAGLIAALIRKMVQVAPGQRDHVHHRAARRHLQRRLRCGLPGPDPARCRGLRQPRATPARGHRGGVRRCQRCVLRQHPDHSGRRHHHRGHQRDPRRRRAQRRHPQRDPELLLLDRVDVLLRDRDDGPHREVRRATARDVGPRRATSRRPGRPRAERGRAVARVARSAAGRDLHPGGGASSSGC